MNKLERENLAQSEGFVYLFDHLLTPTKAIDCSKLDDDEFRLVIRDAKSHERFRYPEFLRY